MSKTLALTEELISLHSVTPADGGCQLKMAERLKPLGFDCETIASGDVTNLWARRGTAQPLLVFAGHTDVVPTGPLQQWTSNPFTPTHRDGKLYGRGAADMKTSLAAMIVAELERHVDTAEHVVGLAGQRLDKLEQHRHEALHRLPAVPLDDLHVLGLAALVDLGSAIERVRDRERHRADPVVPDPREVVSAAAVNVPQLAGDLPGLLAYQLGATELSITHPTANRRAG
jgi:hypothetical protein